jgi:hypothetical protein
MEHNLGTIILANLRASRAGRDAKLILTINCDSFAIGGPLHAKSLGWGAPHPRGDQRELHPISLPNVGLGANIPTVAEFVPGYEASIWQGIGAPKGTPAEIIDTLNKAINAGLADPKIKARLADIGSMAFAGSPRLSPRRA